MSKSNVILSLPPALKSLRSEGIIKSLASAFTFIPTYKLSSSKRNLIEACCFPCTESKGKYCQKPEAPSVFFHSSSLSSASKIIGFSIKLTDTDLLVVWEKVHIAKKKVIKNKIFFTKIDFYISKCNKKNLIKFDEVFFIK